jgi:hypothetical protein
VLAWILSAEAEECRLLAAELSNQPEEPFLLRLATAFDDLHVVTRRRRSPSRKREVEVSTVNWAEEARLGIDDKH